MNRSQNIDHARLTGKIFHDKDLSGKRRHSAVSVTTVPLGYTKTTVLTN